MGETTRVFASLNFFGPKIYNPDLFFGVSRIPQRRGICCFFPRKILLGGFFFFFFPEMPETLDDQRYIFFSERGACCNSLSET